MAFNLDALGLPDLSRPVVLDPGHPNCTFARQGETPCGMPAVMKGILVGGRSVFACRSHVGFIRALGNLADFKVLTTNGRVG